MKILSLLCLLSIPAMAGHASDTWSETQPGFVCGTFADKGPDTWELTLESGYLWNIGNNTDIDYEIIPTQLTLRSPVVWTWWKDENGAEIVVRIRAAREADHIETPGADVCMRLRTGARRACA